MNQFKKPLAMLLALVMLCGAFLSDGKLAFAEGDPIIDVTEGEKPDGTPVANVLEAGNPVTQRRSLHRSLHRNTPLRSW